MNMLETVMGAVSGTRVRDAGQTPPLTLAYIGDTVYDLYVRTMLIETTELTPQKMHLLAAGRVCAAGQAEAFFRMEESLTEAERAVYRRGRNAHSGTMPKNAKVADYRVATGLEALIGYLYLSGADDRIAELVRMGWEETKHGE